MESHEPHAVLQCGTDAGDKLAPTYPIKSNARVLAIILRQVRVLRALTCQRLAPIISPYRRSVRGATHIEQTETEF